MIDFERCFNFLTMGRVFLSYVGSETMTNGCRVNVLWPNFFISAFDPYKRNIDAGLALFLHTDWHFGDDISELCSARLSVVSKLHK